MGFDLYVSGFWHVHAKTPRGIVDLLNSYMMSIIKRE